MRVIYKLYIYKCGVDTNINVNKNTTLWCWTGKNGNIGNIRLICAVIGKQSGDWGEETSQWRNFLDCNLCDSLPRATCNVARSFEYGGMVGMCGAYEETPPKNSPAHSSLQAGLKIN